MPHASKFTKSVRDTIVKAVRAGNYIETASEKAGVHRSTVYRWIEKGEKATSGLYAEFARALKQADAEAEDEALIEARSQDPRWYLERRHPDRWQKRERKEVTGQGGGPIEIRLEWPNGPQPPGE